MGNPENILLGGAVHFSAETGGVYETTKHSVEPDTSYSPAISVGGKPYAIWGFDNNYPQRLIDAVMTDPAAAILEKRRAMHWGKGLMFYKKFIKDGKEVIEPIDDTEVPSEIEDFFFANDMENQMQGFIGDFEWWHSFLVQYITNPSGKVLEVKWQRTKDARPEKRNPSSGKIDNYYLSGNWPNPGEKYMSKVPTFERMGNSSGIYRHQLVSIDKDYFPQPAWHGMTRWLHIAGKIPRWILANIDNSMNIKYHVRIPIEYFLKRHTLEMYGSVEEMNKAIREDEAYTFKQMDAFLAGEKNVSKAFYSKWGIDENGKPIPGWEIIVLDNKVQDEAWLNAYGTASMAINSALGVSPSISGMILPNGLGSGSGSDLREQFNFYMQVMTAQPRQTTLEPFNFIKKRNKWPKEIFLGYRDVILQSIDQNKSGFATQGEKSPTSDKQDNNKIQP